jgi:hypothetical protein
LGEFAGPRTSRFTPGGVRNRCWRILTVVATRLVEPWYECGLGVAGASRAGGACRQRRCRARRRDSGWWLAPGVLWWAPRRVRGRPSGFQGAARRWRDCPCGQPWTPETSAAPGAGGAGRLGPAPGARGVLGRQSGSAALMRGLAGIRVLGWGVGDGGGAGVAGW